MAKIDQLSSPQDVTIGTPAATIEDLIDASINFDPEMHEHFNGKSRFPHFVIGNDNTTLKFKTTDRSVIAKLAKGMEVKNVVLKFKGPTIAVSGTAPAYTSDGTIITATISCMRVVEAIEITNDAEKKAAEFEVTLRAAVDSSTGDDPTIAFGFGGTTPEDDE